MNSNVGQEDDEAKQQEDDNCYKILGCPEDVSQQDLKKRYYDLALKMHPDKGNQQQGDESVVRPEGDFSEVTRAYAKLSGEEERRIHDATLLGKRTENEYLVNEEVSLSDFLRTSDVMVAEEMQELLTRLKDLVPNMPKNKKLSKLEIIQYVIDYIFDLETALESHPSVAGLTGQLVSCQNQRTSLLNNHTPSSSCSSVRQPLSTLSYPVTGVTTYDFK